MNLKEEILARINYSDFYRQYLTLPQRNGKAEAMAKCCFHDDSSPSLSVNLQTGQYLCHGCKESGDVFTLVEKREGIDFNAALILIATKLGIETEEPNPSPIDPQIANNFHEDLLKSAAPLEYLIAKRGISQEVIDLYNLGIKDRRYTIPVYDGKDNLVNIRQYRPNPKANEPKFISWEKGFGSPRLYPTEMPLGDDILLCEGELDCLCAISRGFNAYCTTGGAGVWEDGWSTRFAGKKVNICYDIDKAGKEGAAMVAASLNKFASEVKIVELPLTEPANGDVTDFFMNSIYKPSELQILIDNSPSLPKPKQPNLPQEFGSLIPDRGFLATYTSYAAELTDAPPEFHLAVGLSILGAAIGNNVSMQTWGQSVYPNLWCLILAPSGFYRKSTAMNIGLKLLKRADAERMLPDDFTREKLVTHLSEHSSGVIPVYEFGELMTKLGRDYNAGTKEFLTQVYDGHDYTRSTKAKTEEITAPAVSILAASTIDWVHDRITDGDLRGGFMARFLYWPATKKLDWKGTTEHPGSWITDSLVDRLKKATTIKGTATLSPELHQKYNKWVHSHEEQVNEEHLPSELQGFYTRLATYVLKLAMLYEISTTERIEISSDSLDYAIRCAEYLKSHLVKLISKDIATTRDAKDILKIKQIIRDNPDCSRSYILRTSHFTSRTLDTILMTLVDSEEIVIDKLPAANGKVCQSFRLIE